MPDMTTLAVTGSTGTLGGLVARELAAAGVSQRLLARTPSRAPQLPGATAVPFAYEDRASSIQALEGIETLLMISATENANRLDQHRTFIDAARDAGVEHLVYTSFLAAAPDSVFTLGREHYVTEEYIKASGLSYTFLRDNFYIDFMPAIVGEDGVIRGPAGDGRASVVARADVARVAATVLQNPAAHRNASYGMTGPEALSLTDVAAIIAAHRGTPVTYHNETIPEAYESRRALRRARLAGRRLGIHLHRHRLRRPGRHQPGHRTDHRPAAAVARRVPRGGQP